MFRFAAADAEATAAALLLLCEEALHPGYDRVYALVHIHTYKHTHNKDAHVECLCARIIPFPSAYE